MVRLVYRGQVLLDEGGEFGWIFAADDLSPGVDAGF